MVCTHIQIAALNPGRMNDLLDLTEEVRPVLERAGGRNYRLYRVSVGGTYTGVFYSGVDFDDVDSWGRAYDEWLADPDLPEILERIWGKDGAVTRQSSSLLVQIGDFGATNRPSQPGVVVDLAYWQVTPGRLDDALQTTASLAEFYKPLGGHCRVFRIHFAGELSGLYVVANEFPTMAALGKWQTLFETNPDIQQAIAAWDADPPATRVSSIVSTRLV